MAIHKPLFFYSLTEKKKEFTIIHQIKKLIFNKILIFNFQFWSSLRSFRTSWDDKLKWLCKHIIFPLCASIFNFNFLWIATSCKQLSQWQAKNNEIATAFSKPRNDGVGVLSLVFFVIVSKKSNYSPLFFVIANKVKQSINHYFFIHSQKRKRIIYYSSSQRINFKWNINFQFLIFNFSLNPPVASQHPPLQREARKKRTLLFFPYKGGKPTSLNNS